MDKLNITVGDIVITNCGDIGYIKHICNCDSCKERGFFEPLVEFCSNDDYITFSDYKNNFSRFYRIGTNLFGNKATAEIQSTINKYESFVEELQHKLSFLKSLPDHKI